MNTRVSGSMRLWWRNKCLDEKYWRMRNTVCVGRMNPAQTVFEVRICDAMRKLKEGYIFRRGHFVISKVELEEKSEKS